MGIAWLLAVGIPALIGVGLLIAGWRGRRTDDHPRCRRCGFDLFGSSDPARCTECGRDLGDRRAIRVGGRERRGGLMGAGVVLLLPALLLAAVLGYAASRGLDIQQEWLERKPQAWLVDDLSDDDASLEARILAELERRRVAGELSDETLTRLAVVVLERQPGKNVKEMAPWAVLFREAMDKGLVSREQTGKFLAQSFGMELKTRSPIRQQDAVTVKLEFDHARVGLGPLAMELDVQELRLGEEALRSDYRLVRDAVQDVGGTYSGSMNFPIAPPEDPTLRPVGRRELVLRAKVRVAEPAPQTPEQKARHEVWPVENAYETELVFTAPVEIIPADAPDPAFTGDPSHLPALVEAISVSPLHLREDEGALTMFIQIQSPPVAVLLMPEVIAGGERVATSTAHARPVQSDGGPQPRSMQLYEFTLPAGTERVDVVLRPDLEEARLYGTAEPTWTRALIVRDVPVLHRRVGYSDLPWLHPELMEEPDDGREEPASGPGRKSTGSPGG